MNVRTIFLVVSIAVIACSPRKSLVEGSLPTPTQAVKSGALVVPDSHPLNPPAAARIGDCNSPIYVTEVFADPKRALDRFGEFIELYNASDTAVKLNGWRLSDLGSDSHVIVASESIEISPRSFLVLGQSKDPDRNGGIRVDYEFHSFNLSNNADRVRLEDPCGNLIYDLSYPAAKGWPKHRAGRSVEQTANPHRSEHSRWRLARHRMPGGDRATPGFAPWKKKP